MSTPSRAVPAFPSPPYRIGGDPAYPGSERITFDSGMSLRTYAAIQLRVPDSGIDWLDEMITKAQPVKLTDAQLDRIASDLWDRPFPDAVIGKAKP